MFKNNVFTILILFLLCFKGFSFDINPSIYPFGAIEFFEHGISALKKPILIFNANADFRNVTFSEGFDVIYPIFNVNTNFEYAKFKKPIRFQYGQFQNKTSFNHSQFDDSAAFWNSTFNDTISFIGTTFSNNAEFSSVNFKLGAIYNHTTFNKSANFFRIYSGHNLNFENSRFRKIAGFSSARFDGNLKFINCYFNGRIDFNYSKIAGKLDFRKCYFDSMASAEFILTTIGDTVFLGRQNSKNIHRYDFTRSKFFDQGSMIFHSDTSRDIPKKIINNPGANLYIFGPVDLKIQLEKFKYLTICDTLDYYSKQDIITILKEKSFEGDNYKKHRFELDYIFEKSTLYQKESSEFQRYSIFCPIVWWRFFYNLTMGIGYRPFKLIYVIIIVLLFFTFGFLIFIPDRINSYLINAEKKDNGLMKSLKTKTINKKFSIENFIYCTYFSSLLIFSFRLKRDIILFFSPREKLFIVGEWFIGILIYLYFLFYSKSGSILQNLKDFFIG